MTSYKTCTVPMCRSTTIKYPNKLFIHVPKCPQRRKQWLQLARRDPEFTSDKSAIFFCEDHFDLPNDMENYIRYSVMGSVGKIRMKPDCLPSKFQCQPDNKTHCTTTPQPRSAASKRQRLNSDTMEHQPEAGTINAVKAELCRICFATDCKMYSMPSSTVLNKAYETLTGIMTADEEHLPRYLCTECADRLMNCARFRRRSLRAHVMLLDIVRRHGQVTVELIRSELQIHNPFSSDPADNPNEENFDFDNDLRDLEEVNKTTDALDDTTLEDIDDNKKINDIKLELDSEVNQSCINSEESANDMALIEVKKEDDDLNNQENSGDFENGYIINQDIVRNEIISNNMSIEFLGRSSKSTNASLSAEAEHSRTKRKVVLSEPLPTEEVKQTPKTMRMTPRDVNKLKIVKQETPEADGPSTDDMLRCDICPYKTDSDDQLMEHLKWHAATEKPYSCFMCDYKIHSKSALNRHVQSHYNEKLYSCQICNKAFKYECSVKIHMRIHSGDNKYLCYVCNKVFVSKSHLERHLISHNVNLTNSSDNQYSCDVCKKTFSLKHNLQSHFKVHTGEKPYSCNVCKKSFSRTDNLKDHLEIHSDETPYSCDICSKAFRKKRLVKSHILHTHFTSREFVTSREVVKKHLCEFCKKTFKDNHQLQSHLKTHCGETIHSCHICKKMFRRKRYLRQHLKIHSLEKPYSCDICRKTFKLKQHIRLHMKTHSDTKAQCDICQRTFTHSWWLNTHIKKVHAVDPK